jgi:hypothetical protein
MELTLERVVAFGAGDLSAAVDGRQLTLSGKVLPGLQHILADITEISVSLHPSRHPQGCPHFVLHLGPPASSPGLSALIVPAARTALSWPLASVDRLNIGTHTLVFESGFVQVGYPSSGLEIDLAPDGNFVVRAHPDFEQLLRTILLSPAPVLALDRRWRHAILMAPGAPGRWCRIPMVGMPGARRLDGAAVRLAVEAVSGLERQDDYHLNDFLMLNQDYPGPADILRSLAVLGSAVRRGESTKGVGSWRL